jgi:predicted kinase
VGLPGSGKTTLARSLARRHGAVRLSPDEWMTDLGVDLYDSDVRDRLERRLLLLAADALNFGGRVVVEFGSWAEPERAQLLDLGRTAGAAVELHVLDPGIEELWRRLSKRNAEPGQVPIDRETLEGYLALWAPPGEAERNRFDRPLE